MSQPLVTFYTNSFNRRPLLRNLLRSFELCNQYENVEWVITDYGSHDGSREWLADYARQSSFPIRIVLGDEEAYFASLQLPQLDRRTRLEAILRWYRNQARAAARGEYLFDVATDHQFIRPGRWVEEFFEIFRHREQQVGHDDISGIFTFAYFRWRLDKPNNRRGREQNSAAVPYYITEEKPYVDYSVMKRRIAQSLGPYWELTNLTGKPTMIERWYAQDPTLHPESEYSRRCEQRGLRRVVMKYPAMVSFKNRELSHVQTSAVSDDLMVPLWTLENMKQRFGSLPRPISSEELCGQWNRLKEMRQRLSQVVVRRSFRGL